MKYRKPHYKERFVCAAGACTDTCCAGWGIVIDEETMEKYKAYEGGFGSRLRNEIDWAEGSFRQYGKRCAFLNEENLCDIHIEAGHDMFCKTCRNYPNHIEEFENVREISLSLSCPVVAKMVLGMDEKVTFVTEEDDEEETDADFDFFLYDKLIEGRELAIAIMQNRNLPAQVRMAMALGLAHDMQQYLERGQLFQMDDLFAKCRKASAASYVERKLSKYEDAGDDVRSELFRVFTKLEILRDDWPDMVMDGAEILFGKSVEEREADRKKFLASGVWEEHPYTEQLMVYFIFTYFAGAVYDGEIFAKMKFAAASTLLIEWLVQAAYTRDESIGMEEIADIAHRYSREVEHSDLNLKRVGKIFENRRTFTLERMLRILK